MNSTCFKNPVTFSVHCCPTTTVRLVQITKCAAYQNCLFMSFIQTDIFCAPFPDTYNVHSFFKVRASVQHMYIKNVKNIVLCILLSAIWKADRMVMFLSYVTSISNKIHK